MVTGDWQKEPDILGNVEFVLWQRHVLNVYKNVWREGNKVRTIYSRSEVHFIGIEGECSSLMYQVIIFSDLINAKPINMCSLI